MTKKFAHFLSEMSFEATRQDLLKQKGKFDYTPSDMEMSIDRCLTVMTEELGEIAREIQEGCDPQKMYTELCQLATLAMRTACRFDGVE